MGRPADPKEYNDGFLVLTDGEKAEVWIDTTDDSAMAANEDVEWLSEHGLITKSPHHFGLPDKGHALGHLRGKSWYATPNLLALLEAAREGAGGVARFNEPVPWIVVHLTVREEAIA